MDNVVKIKEEPKDESKAILGVNTSKANVITAFYGNAMGTPTEGTSFVHGELRIQYIADKLIEFVLITKICPNEEDRLKCAFLEKNIVVEYFKARKDRMFLDFENKELYRLSNKPKMKKALGKAIVEEYIWNDAKCELTERPTNGR